MDDIPAWVSWLQALAVPAIAFGGLVIAGLQWWNARQKLTLDLFQHRLGIYQRIVAAVNEISMANTTIADQYRTILDAKLEARFLFGPDVNAIIEKIDKAAWDLKVFYEIRDGGAFREPERREMVANLSTDASQKPLEMLNLVADLGTALQSYLKLHSKAP